MLNGTNGKIAHCGVKYDLWTESFFFFLETGSVILTLNGTDGKIAHSSVKYDCCTYSKMKLKILSCSSILSILNYEVISRRVLFMNVAL